MDAKETNFPTTTGRQKRVFAMSRDLMHLIYGRIPKRRLAIITRKCFRLVEFWWPR
ncbi:hypothetical protein BGX21_003836, partial [Mortierella sp. AD011]